MNKTVLAGVDANTRLDVPWSVCLSVTAVSLATTSPAMEMPFGYQTHVGSRNHTIDGVPLAPPGQYDGSNCAAAVRLAVAAITATTSSLYASRLLL